MDSLMVKTFSPTLEEFKDFNKYISYLESIGAHHSGVVKIIPPAEWTPRVDGYEDIIVSNLKIKRPLQQNFEKGTTDGVYQIQGNVKSEVGVKNYMKLTKKQLYRTPSHSSYAELEEKYWESLSQTPAISPIYGCDVDESMFDKYQKYWNLQNLNTFLKAIKDDVKGVNKPYTYFGMWKSTFAWHVEDMDLYSINYLHYGMPKTWYVVPPKYGYLLEQKAFELFPNVASWCTNFMRHKTCLISPFVLDKLNIPYQRVVQEERSAIIVFPYAYHSGFNHGFNIAEAVNFASERWIEYGKRARQCDCQSSRVVFSMDKFVAKLQPHRYKSWKNGLDIGPHPEDPKDVKTEFKMRKKDIRTYIKMKRKQLMERNKILETIRGNDVAMRALRKEKEQPFNMDRNSKVKTYYIYQHYEYFNAKIQIEKKSMTVHPQSMELLKTLFDMDTPKVESLIEEGIFIKVGENTMVVKEKDGWIMEMEFVEKKVHVYFHAGSGLEAVVDPDTNELFGPQMTGLTAFLKNKDVRYYIEKGKFCYRREDKRGCLLTT